MYTEYAGSEGMPGYRRVHDLTIRPHYATARLRCALPGRGSNKWLTASSMGDTGSTVRYTAGQFADLIPSSTQMVSVRG